MTVHTIRSDQLTVQAKDRGAELTSIRTPDGYEMLWQPVPTVWAAQAPLLFPVIGKLADGRYELDGVFYEMGWHGFAAEMDFLLLRQSEHELVFGLSASPETLAVYPFRFELTVTYRIEGSRLTVEYEVGNPGDTDMPFSIGAHPGFNLPASHEDSFLEFECDEILEARLLGAHQLLSDRTVRVLDGTRTLPLSRTLFNRGVLILTGMKSKHISLCCRTNPRRLTVEFAGFPYVGLWSKPGAPFICIEPWFGLPDPERSYGSFRDKPGMITLTAGQRFSCCYSISVSDMKG